MDDIFSDKNLVGDHRSSISGMNSYKKFSISLLKKIHKQISMLQIN